MPSQGQLTDDERFGIELLTGLLTKGGWYDTTTGDHWKCALKEPLTRNLAEERAYDIVVGTYYSNSDKIKSAKARHYNRKLGFEKCLQLAFNFKNDYSVTEIQEFIERLLITDWNQLTGGCFCVEFYSDNGKWNPHIHCWLPYSPPGQVRQLATRKFKTDRCNIWVGPGNSNLKNYVMGIKRDSKSGDVQMDTKFRLANNFKDHYEF